MNIKEELDKLIIESYDRGVADAKQEALVAIAQAVYAEREACAKVCEGWTHADGDKCAEAIRARGQDPMPLFDDWPGGFK
jgi:hypothetical protein